MVERFPSTQRDSSVIHSYAWLIAVIGLLMLGGSGVAYFLNQNWRTPAQVGLILGAVLILEAVLLRPDVVRAVLAGRPVRYASNALVMSLAFIGILALINFLALKYDWEYDATENGQFSLSKQTIQLLKKLDSPVHVLGFFQTGDPRRTLAEDYLARCSDYTDQLSYEFYDPNVEPALAKSYDLDNYGLIFVNGDHTVEISGVDERDIVSGLVRATSEQTGQVYFITGHGEPNVADDTPAGYSKVKQALERENYVVETINLATINHLSETAVLILAGLERQLRDSEKKLLATWVKDGGKLMVLADPFEPVPLAGLLKQYGLSVGNDLVADKDNYRYGFAPTSPLIAQYPPHDITKGLDGYLTFFPLARSLQIAESQLGQTWQIAPLLTTGPGSWAETDLSTADLAYDEGVDLPGPIHIGVVAEDTASGLRLVVFGSADFINNQHLLDEVANRDLFMNAVNWLTEADDLMAIRPKEITNRRLFLTPFQNSLIVFISLIAIPVLILLTGAVVWWKRR